MRRSYKRIVAGVLAAMMLLDNAPMLTSEASSNNTGSTIPGSGSFEGVLSDVFCVVVPTEPETTVDRDTADLKRTFDFLLDPKQLAQKGSLLNKKIEPGATVYFENAAGTPYEHSSISDAYTVINKSTTDINVELDASITMQGVKLTTDKNFANDNSASVYLALVDNKGKTVPLDKYGAVMRSTLAGSADGYNVIYDSGAKKYSYELKAGFTQFPKYEFRLTGACNSANSWSQVGQELDAQIEVIWSVSARPKNVSPSIAKQQYAMEIGKPVQVGIDLGSGDLAAKGIKAITYSDAGTLKTVSTDKYVVEQETLRFRASYIDNLIKGDISSRTFSILFNDKLATSQTITLSTNDTVPTINESEYTMTNGQPVTVEVDYGSGTLAATGVASITYINAAGSVVTVPTDKYVLENGVLKFRASYITQLLNEGKVERDYTITFNDKARTEKTITLKITGTAPSITPGDYIMSKNQYVEVPVELGSGALAATGIASITYVNAAGATVTVSEDKYVYEKKVVRFRASYITQMLDEGKISREFTITFNNAVKTKDKVTLETLSAAPSIAEGDYRMISGQPVKIDVDLGSGALGATKIKSITYVNASGATVTLPADKYVYENGVLKFRASYITQIISEGKVSREFTITLNDKDGTQGRVNLEVKGTQPAVVGATTYTMKSNNPVSITVDLGTDDLKATGIKYITYKNASGQTITVPTSNYVYGNNILKFRASYITQMLKEGKVSREYTIVFNDISSTAVKVTLVK